MTNRAFRIAYDGTSYYGFQRQPDVPTVEDRIFDALRSLDAYVPESSDEAGPDRPAGYAGAGRTDAGVSALAQTIALETPAWLTPRALNAELPADIRAWAATDVPASFHATHDADRRTYTYHLYGPSADRTVETAPGPGETGAPIDDDRFRAACDRLSGRHDFHNLTPDDENTERSPTIEATREGAFLVVTVSAGGFARELVRRLVSLAHAIGTGAVQVAKIDRVLAAESLPGHEGVAPAPPEPLVLTDVRYPGVAFEVDDRAARSARRVFEQRRIDRRIGSRVAGQLASGVVDRDCY